MIIEDVLLESGQKFKVYPFDIHGSDERQYSSPGFRINICSLFKDRYYDYSYYHSSLDNLEFVNGAQINETFNLYKKILLRIENLIFYKSQNMFCEPMLSKYDLYPKIGGSLVPNKNINIDIDNILWLMFYCDGSNDLLSISNKINVKIEDLLIVANSLSSKGLLKKL